VKVEGLVKVPHLNGSKVTLIDFDAAAGKWRVDLNGVDVKVKPQNLFPAAEINAQKATVTPSYKQLLIDGKWVNSASGQTFESIDPRTEQKICDFQAGGAEDINKAVGVCGQIIPWNFPMLMAAWKLGPALACGNTVVLKPSEKTPMTALELGQLCLEAGIPEGVVNVVPGLGGEAGEALAKSELVDKVAFTGSTGTALRIQQVAGIKPLTTELGGKSPALVFSDADVDDAVEKIHFGLFFNHGQCCCAASRVYVHESVYDEFVEKSIKKANERSVGDPFGQVDQGPQVDKLQFEKIMGYINEGKNAGLNLVAGGARLYDAGYFVEPTIFADMPDTSRLYKEEIFGPVMGISKFSDESDVIRRANASRYGLAAGIFTGSLDTATRVQRHLRAGTIWINCYNVFDNATPFGGYKESGVGREKGQEALKNYTSTKCVTMPISGDPRWL